MVLEVFSWGLIKSLPIFLERDLSFQDLEEIPPKIFRVDLPFCAPYTKNMLACSPPLPPKNFEAPLLTCRDLKPLPISLTKAERAEYETLKDSSFCLGPLRGMSFDEAYRKHVLLQFRLQGYEGYRFRRYCDLRNRIPPNKSHVKLRTVQDYVRGFEGFFPFLIKPNPLQYQSYLTSDSNGFLLSYIGPQQLLRTFSKRLIKFGLVHHLGKGHYYDYLACLRGKQTFDAFSNLRGPKRDLARQSYYRLQMVTKSESENLFEFLTRGDSQCLRDLWRMTILVSDNTAQEAETFLYLAEFLQFNYELLARTCAWIEARFSRLEANKILLDPYLSATSSLGLHTIPDVIMTTRGELFEIASAPLENHPRDFANLIVTASLYKYLTGQTITTLVIYDPKSMLEVRYRNEPIDEVKEREILPDERKTLAEKKKPEDFRKRVPQWEKSYPQIRC